MESVLAACGLSVIMMLPLSTQMSWVALSHQAMWFEPFSTGGDGLELVQPQSPTQSPWWPKACVCESAGCFQGWDRWHRNRAKKKRVSTRMIPCLLHVLTTQANSLRKEDSLGTAGAMTAASRKACCHYIDTVSQNVQENPITGAMSSESEISLQHTLDLTLNWSWTFSSEVYSAFLVSQSAPGEEEQITTFDSNKSYPKHFPKMTVVSSSWNKSGEPKKLLNRNFQPS